MRLIFVDCSYFMLTEKIHLLCVLRGDELQAVVVCCHL
jgi:hypothetical protein